MKRVIVSTIWVMLFLSVSAVKPYCLLGESSKTVHQLTAEVTQLLMESDFEVLGLYHPNNNENLCVVVFTCDELSSMATSVTDKGAFGTTLKIGLVGSEGKTDVTFLNPHYLKHAYFGSTTNRDEVMRMTAITDSLVKEALRPIGDHPVYYGSDMEEDELSTYHFLPFLPRYHDVVVLDEYLDYEEAVVAIKDKLLHGGDNCELVYELVFEDKEISVLGLAFYGKDNPDEEMLALMGVDCVSSMPIEILVQGDKAYMLDGRYRIPLFKSDLSKWKVFRLAGIAADMKSCVKKLILTE
ncbi:hypothetical protein [Saccharicrinis fermentans]|uniref:Uncharacterized protein n=1 Tax=Saccharicrinis fermentans DSM 9555 = JCM 21142 TaxID=869213 RepID=W7YND7_9BACT|nr:hypothetical protein [Saccharicrinis fermentans]GAF03949.1 hypothetical protein JCM21142_72639 [Saccharicrinis fermentans DSM 9555 = JCM 21142]